jgi:MFS transporter, DHA2 family, multidrug resistance protein
VATAARDTLGGAVGVASALPTGTADELLTVARAAFVNGMHVAAVIAGVIGLALATFAFITLRESGTERSATEPICVEPTMVDEPVLTPLAKPARECF